jgi:SpoVK/Ycf46/Vps4 family AAA+-type ATPase
MADIPIQLSAPDGQYIGRMKLGVAALLADAEQTARDRNLSKRTALSTVLEEHLLDAGFKIGDTELAEATAKLDLARRGEKLIRLELTVRPGLGNGRPPDGADRKLAKSAAGKNEPMTTKRETNQLVSFFELEQKYPDAHAKAWYERLVGLDQQKKELLIKLEMLLYPQKVEAWSRKHHGKRVLQICELERNLVPLILFEGDVGTGKTALAETIGDALARKAGSKGHVHLLKINTQIRGTGLVGEMSDLIAQAFVQAEARAKSLNGEPLLLLMDEADALAASRDTQQMHHEDKAGLNTLLQRLNNLRLTRLPLAVIFITNRLDALDPAIVRRAALKLSFPRPDEEVRGEILKSSLPELDLKAAQVSELVKLTGEREPKNKGVPFTSSDITDRLLTAALRAAYTHDRPLRYEDILKEAKVLDPSPRMGTT